MATKSIYKNIVIKDKKLTNNLVFALENAEQKRSKDVKLSKSFREIKKEQIKELFGEEP